MPLKLTQFKAASVSAAPVYLDREASVEKVCRIISECAENGARLIAFPETFIPGYPHWLHVLRVDQGHPLHIRLIKNAVEVPSEATDRMCDAARKADAVVVVGINERDPVNWGSLYNTNLIIDRTGRILGKHRKIMPTMVEKICWGFGDGSSLKVYDTDLGRLGTLICGENTNPLAKFALLAQGEQIHVANYPAGPMRTAFKLPEGIEIRTRAMCYEGKVFTLTSGSTFSDEMRDMICLNDEHREFTGQTPASYTAIHGPNGVCLGGPVNDKEEVVYADIDLGKGLIPKIRHDVVGHYNRFDIMWLGLNRSPQRPIVESGLTTAEPSGRLWEHDFFRKLQELTDNMESTETRDRILSLIKEFRG
jgi:predicted amidohydrolase